MAKRKAEDGLLVSAARVVGATLGRVKRLTIGGIEQATGKFEHATESSPGELRKSSAPKTTGRVPGPSKKQVAPRKARGVRLTGKTIPTGDDFDAATASPQEGGSRSPVRAESQRRGKSRSKTSKSRSR
ncbi:MAG TPA: hypothetical protein VF011_16900 [Terriglobales bacterium]